MIQVLNAIYGGERFHFDGMKLVDKGKHLPGFLLDKDGKLKAPGAEISGHIEAESGAFDSVDITSSAKFSGRIFSDDLVVDYDPNPIKRFPDSGNYAVNTRPSAIQYAVNAFWGKNPAAQSTYLVDDGMIAGKKIKPVGFAGETPAQGGGKILEIYAADGTRCRWINGLVETAFWFQIGTGGKKVRFNNLPNSAGAATSGTLYKTQIPGSNALVLAIKE
jgi:hypothetical protein